MYIVDEGFATISTLRIVVLSHQSAHALQHSGKLGDLKGMHSLLGQMKVRSSLCVGCTSHIHSLYIHSLFRRLEYRLLRTPSTLSPPVFVIWMVLEQILARNLLLPGNLYRLVLAVIGYARVQH